MWQNRAMSLCSPLTVGLDLGILDRVETTDAEKFPAKVYVYVYKDGKYSSYVFPPERLKGLAVFNTADIATKFSLKYVRKMSGEAVEMLFEDVLLIALEKRKLDPEYKCVFLLDDVIERPLATYWL